MSHYTPRLAASLLLFLFCAGPAIAAGKKDFRYNLPADGSVTIVNPNGSVTVRQGPGRQVVISASAASDKVEIDARQQGGRIEARTHELQPAAGNDGKVDYEVTVPADATVDIRAAAGPIRVENVRGNLHLEGDTAEITINGGGGSVSVRTVNGPVTLTNVKARVDVTSTGGNITMNGVTGSKVTVNTTSGAVTYKGDFAGDGDYSFTNHTGAMDVFLPASASVDLTARSMNGSVENDLQLQQPQHARFAASPGKAVGGVLGGGGSTVALRSFSGKIRVKKQ